MTKPSTPTIDRHRELSKQSQLLGDMFLKSAANRVLMDRELQAIDDAERAAAAKSETQRFEGKPHHLKLADLRARAPMLADVYERNHTFDLAAEADEQPTPPPAAA